MCMEKGEFYIHVVAKQGSCYLNDGERDDFRGMRSWPLFLDGWLARNEMTTTPSPRPPRAFFFFNFDRAGAQYAFILRNRVLDLGWMGILCIVI